MAKKKAKEKGIISEEENVLNDKGYAFTYNLTMVAAVATVAIFTIGVALYIAVMM